MPSTTGPQSLPYPLPSDAPDVPGAFLSLLQTMQVGGAYPYTTYAALTGAGNGFNGQLATVSADSTAWRNGIYMSNGSGWSLVGGLRNTVAPSMGSNYALGVGQVFQRGTQVTLNIQVVKSGSAIAVNDTVFTLPVGSRPPSLVLATGGTTTGGQQGPITYQISTAGVVTVNSVAAASAATAWVTGVFENA